MACIGFTNVGKTQVRRVFLWLRRHLDRFSKIGKTVFLVLLA